MVDFGDQYTPQLDVLRKNNDFKIKELKLIAFDESEYDVRNIRIKLSIYSDLFQNCMMGSLSFFDALDIPQMYPLIGQERLKIVLTRHSEVKIDKELPDIKFNFRVYKMSNRSLAHDKSQGFVLHFVSEEYIKCLKTKIRRTYKDMRYSEMIEELFDEFVFIEKPLVIEPTKFDQKFAISNTDPLETFNTMASRSISDEGNGEGYVFYEDNEQFNYVSVGKLIDGPVKEYYGFGLVNYSETINSRMSKTRPDPQINLYENNNTSDLRTVQQYLWSNSFDVINNQTNGMYNSKLWTYDFVRQLWFDDYDFDYQKQFGEFKHLGNEPINTDELDAGGDPLSHVRLRHTNKDHDKTPWISSHEPGILPYYLEDYIQKRTSQLHQLHSNRIILTVAGDPRRKVGDVIKFDLPEVSSKVTEEFRQELDKYFAGKWLIISINHKLHPDEYFMDIEIAKDSFEVEPEHIDLIKKYKELMESGDGL